MAFPFKKELCSALVWLFLIFSGIGVQAQRLPDLDDLLDWAGLESAKFEAPVIRKGFFSKGLLRKGDTVHRHYVFPKLAATKKREADSSERNLVRIELKSKCLLEYATSSSEEHQNLIEQLKEKKFHYPTEVSGDQKVFYQLKDVLVEPLLDSSQGFTMYTLRFFRKIFPEPIDVNYGDDLFVFTSHEYLVHYFGEQHVQRDMYFISGNDMVNCSILFPNTSRQVVFLWNDQANRRGTRSILFGGQQNVAGSSPTANYVGQNSWQMKSGLHAGMTLYQLLARNEAEIVFHGGNSPNTGLVVADNKGKLNFNKEQVELGCINCNDEAFARAKLIDGEEAVAEGRILFILSIAVQLSHIETGDW